MKSLIGKPSKNVAMLFISFGFIIVMMAIIFVMKQQQIQEKEYFVTSTMESLPLLNLNGGSCQRNLAFTSFASSTYTAAARASRSDFKTSGSCPVNMKAPVLAIDMAKIEENRMSYLLKYACINLAYKIIDIDTANKNNNVVIYVDNNNSSMDNAVNLLYLFLLNPVFIEFEGSDAYIPDYGSLNKNAASFYTNFNTGKILQNSSNFDVACSFKRLLSAGASSKNATFLYKDIAKLDSIIKNPQNGFINTKIYYLDNDNSVAGTRRFLEEEFLNQRSNNVGVIPIYKKSYINSVDKQTDEFYFHQNLYTLITNSQSPVISFKFNISIPQAESAKYVNKNVEIMKIYMDTTTGKYSRCSNFEPIGKNNHNLLNAVVSGFPNIRDTFLLTFSTSDNGYNQPCSPEIALNKKANNSSMLQVELPFSPNSEQISVIITITPFEKITLCKWKFDKDSFFIFKRSTECSSKNNMNKLFSQRSAATSNPLENEDIMMNFDTKCIQTIKYVQLGHINYINEYYADL